MELKQLAENIHYIPNATNVGVIVSNTKAILVDSGLDDDTGRKILQTLEKSDMSVTAIINTHSHADHIGGNAYIKAKTGARIYAPDFEASIVHHPYFEPFFLFAGANPIKDLKNKFLMAKPSDVDCVIPSDTTLLNIDGMELNIVSLPGHALNQIGIAYEGVFFCSDSIFSTDVLKKHKIPFCIDILKQKETLSFLKETRYTKYVPSHAEPSGSIDTFVEAYQETVAALESNILELAMHAKSSEEILTSLCNTLDITIKGAQQFYLLHTSVMAYLSSLYEEGQLKTLIAGNRLLWQKI